LQLQFAVADAVVAALISAVATIMAKAKILIIVCDGDDDSSWEEPRERCRVRTRERESTIDCTLQEKALLYYLKPTIKRPTVSIIRNLFTLWNI